MNIPRENIQVLIAYTPEVGVNTVFKEFMDANQELAQFYAYPDNRKNPKYTSSVRPHILKQHFKLFPELEKETVFYHDSDILFSRIPQIKEVEINDVNYVSDTRNYLDSDYVRASGSEELLNAMADIVGIPVSVIDRHKSDTGGAQYILKGIKASFWEKVEKDSEKLYELMSHFNKQLWENQYPEKKEYRSKKRGIQAWCADMWAVLWNLWYAHKKVEIHPEMDFSWPYSPVEEWHDKAIQHYSGNIENKKVFFKKSEYLNYMPWYDEALLSIPSTSCSYKIVECIKSRREELDNARPRFPNTCVLLDGRKYSRNQIISFEQVKKYIQKHLNVNVYLLYELGNTLKKGASEDKGCLEIIRGSGYQTLIYMDHPYVIDSTTIQGMLEGDQNEDILVFNPEALYSIDQLFSETFSSVLDVNLFHLNQGKFNIHEKTSDFLGQIHRFSLKTDPVSRKKQLENMLKKDIPLFQKSVSFPQSYVLPVNL